VTDGSFHAYGTGDSYIEGSLGIGTTSTSSKLTVDGSIKSTSLLGGSTNLVTDANGVIIRDPSDERLKENITDVENALELLTELRGVRYEWIDKERFGAQTEIGFIAQEVDLVLPEVVSKGGDYWSLNKSNMIALVVEAVKELWDIVRGQGEKIDELEARINELEAALDIPPPATVPDEDEPVIDNTQSETTAPEPGTEDQDTSSEDLPETNASTQTEDVTSESATQPEANASPEATPESSTDESGAMTDTE
jgi:hypothetical protein